MSMPERRGTQALEAWARRATSGYEGVTITNMSTAWRDGLAFCALIHHFRPDLIEFSSLKSENILENNSLAFRVAEQQLGIPALLDAEDMVANPVPDRLSILTYVSQYYRAFSAMGLLAERKHAKEGKVGTGTEKAPPSPTPTTPVTRPHSLQTTPKTTETKTDKVLGRVGGGGLRGRRELCVTCHLPVFLAERLMVGAPGQLMHRTCFRCARCSTQLTLAGYYQTERGQYCCETCPDEERSSRPTIPPAIASAGTGTDSDSDSSSQESESDEEMSEATPRLPDTPAPTPSPTPPPKPRTVFLSQTLNDSSNTTTTTTNTTTTTTTTRHFTKVSSALFGDTDKASKAREHSPDPTPLPRSPKSLRTDRADQPVVDTGQTTQHTPKPASTSSSIVARRLQMFREMGAEKERQDTEESRKRSCNVGRLSDNTTTTTTTTNIPSITITSSKRETTTTTTTTTTTNPFGDEDDITEGQTDTETDRDQTEKTDDRNTEKSEGGTRDKEESERDKRDENETEKELGEVVHDEEVVSKAECDYNNTDSEVVSEEVVSKEPQDKCITQEDQDQEEEYPDDLNPFGSEDESEGKGDSEERKDIKADSEGRKDEGKDLKADTEGATAPSPSQSPHVTTTGRKVIKANLNPFESDEDEEENIESKKEVKKSLNPFWSDDEEEEEEIAIVTRGRSDTTESAKGTQKVKPPRPPPPTLPRNRSPSTISTASTASISSTPRKKKVIAPPPPSSPTLSLSSSPSGSVALRKKARRAPAPPQQHVTPSGSPSQQNNTPSLDTTTTTTTVCTADREDADEVLSWKLQKDLKNHSNKINGTQQQLTPPPKPPRSPYTDPPPADTSVPQHCPVSKSEAGEWKRKKGPAPPRPVPQKRALKKLPMKVIQQELLDIEIKQTELERQGVLLETSIRKRTEGSSAPPSPQQEEAPSTPPSSGLPASPSSIEVEDMILQLFELVNEKNELFRRQTELMYLKREKRLEEEHVELEYQIRCLMMKPPSERTPEDTAQEEELIGRLVKVVEQRDEIINCLELDRLREAQEDESIATHMMQYQEKHIDGLDNGNNNNNNNTEPTATKKKKTLKLPKKKKKKKEKKGASGGDADKDVDESEIPPDTKKKKKKKKWLF